MRTNERTFFEGLLLVEFELGGGWVEGAIFGFGHYYYLFLGGVEGNGRWVESDVERLS